MPSMTGWFGGMLFLILSGKNGVHQEIEKA